MSDLPEWAEIVPKAENRGALESLDARRARVRGRDRAPLLSVKVANETFVVASESVVGIERTDRLQRNPASGEVAGWLLGTEEDVPVVSLAARLGLASGSKLGSGAILRLGGGVSATEGRRAYGILVDGLERSTFGSEHRRSIPSALGGLGSYFRAAWINDGRLELELDLERVATLDGSDLAASGVGEFAAVDDLPPLWAAAGATRGVVFAAHGGVSPERFALAASQVLEVSGDLNLRAVPGAILPLLGLVAWRDRAVPVFDLGTPREATAAQKDEVPPRVLIARARHRRAVVGLAVAAEIRFESLAVLAAAEPCPKEAPDVAGVRTASARVLGSFMIDGRTLSVPDLDSLLDFVSSR